MSSQFDCAHFGHFLLGKAAGTSCLHVGSEAMLCSREDVIIFTLAKGALFGGLRIFEQTKAKKLQKVKCQENGIGTRAQVWKNASALVSMFTFTVLKFTPPMPYGILVLLQK